jgi:D-tyrosyl-tRNA(Tyr) deacylase
VTVDGNVVGKINEGLMILIGAKKGDTEKDVEYCVEKALNLRIFTDENDNNKLYTVTIKNGDGEIRWVRKYKDFSTISNSDLANSSLGAFNA